MAESISDTKIQILESCITPKSWSDLREIANVSEPSLLTHVNFLQEKQLLSKNDERQYLTTKEGLKILDLVPYVRTSSAKTQLELKNMVRIGLKPTDFTLGQKIKLELGGLLAIEQDKTLGRIYGDVTKIIQSAVTLRAPRGLEPDSVMWKAVNRLIGTYTKKTRHDIKHGKLTMLIEFNLETAFEKVIRDESDEEIKNHLIKNKEKILTTIYKAWHSITVDHII
ncbi:MAG: hypothetical protein KGL95_06490 [Patescibacteria group bacterium]|nr:hypothetical protein [Patescibacteria group bacterium]